MGDRPITVRSYTMPPDSSAQISEVSVEDVARIVDPNGWPAWGAETAGPQLMRERAMRKADLIADLYAPIIAERDAEIRRLETEVLNAAFSDRLDMEAGGSPLTWQEIALTAEKERDEALARVEDERISVLAELRSAPADEEIRKLLGMAQIAGGHPNDDDPEGFDAQVGREFIRLRHNIAAALARVREVEGELEFADRVMLNAAGAALVAEARAEALQAQVEWAASLLTSLGQIIDVVKREWDAEGQWSEWDQEQRDGITAWLTACYALQATPGEAEPATGPSQGSGMTYNGGVDE